MTREELLRLIEQAAAEGWKELDLAGLGLQELPPEIGKCTQLESLVLGKIEWDGNLGKSVGNQLTTLPEEIAALTKLKRLEISHNKLTELPTVILQLLNLKVLHLGGNQISEISEVLAKLSNLTELKLYNNQLGKIPSAILQLLNLKVLHLGGNQIREIPNAIAQLSNLTELSLGSNQIGGIPRVILQLTNLTTLYLWGNQIRQIPNALAKLSHLTHLYLSFNQIAAIPEAIAKLSHLTHLDLWGNQIAAIPEAIAKLSHLRELYLGGNQIEAVPEWLETLPKLKTLDLRDNPLPISPEVLGNKDEPGTPEAIFNYLQKLRSGEVRPLNEAKVLLVGQGSVGKTSLINRLIYNQYNPNEPQTDGLTITDWQITVNTKKVKLNVWDFGGQEIYHATHQFFLTKRSLYILVCNCRTSEEENRLEYWLKLIESFGDASPVILVGNKCDEQPLDINRKALQEKYPNIKAILETSCQSGTGIDDLRAAIHAEIAQLKEVYDLLPLSWFQVKQRLETLDKDFITISEYATLCAKEDIDRETDQIQLVTLLHNLGIVLNFREHPILQSTNILNPHWVTEGIYALLSDDDLKTKTKGILTHADLDRILDPTRYPSHRYNCLTELMGEFQLCFPIRDCPVSTFLIPGILPKEEPKNTQLEGDTLEFQYRYRILPDSVLSRFIVLTHEKIHEATYWRTGVMLEYREGSEVYNIARIKSDPEEDKIFIAVSGRESTRRSFLSLIRDTLHKIHNSFGNLEVSKWVPVPGYPNADPLDYEELLGLEEMGETKVTIGKLKLKLDLRQLLDGYEPIAVRRRRQMGDRDLYYEESGYPGVNIHVHQTNSDRRSHTVHQHGKGDNFGGDRIQRNKITNNPDETPER